MTCRTCGWDRMGAEPEARLAYVRYVGNHPEPSITFPVPCPGRPVWPREVLFVSTPDGVEPAAVGSHRNEIVALPNRRWVKCSVWAALWLAGARQRHGPWVEVKVTPAAWREVTTRAPWIKKATAALALADPGFLADFRRCEINEIVQ